VGRKHKHEFQKKKKKSDDDVMDELAGPAKMCIESRKTLIQEM